MKGIASLDGFRALSLLVVFVGHTTLSANFPRSGDAPAFSWINPHLGVRMFFVLSGFLITTLLLREEASRGRISVKRFYQRRVLRIIPALFFLVGAVWVFERFHDCGLKGIDYAAALTFTTAFIHSSSATLAHTWSLSVEEQFYLCWPLILYLVRGHRSRLALSITFLAILPLARFALGKGQPLDYIGAEEGDAIMWGCLMALLHARHGQALRPSLESGLARLAAFALFAGVEVLREIHFAGSLTGPFGVPAQSASFAFLLCSYAYVPGGPVYGFLNLALLRWIGILSYSLYLWQQVFFFSTTPQPAWWNLFPQNIVLAALAASFSYFVVERPFLALKQKCT